MRLLKDTGRDANIEVLGCIIPISLSGLKSAPIEFLIDNESVMKCKMLPGLNFLKDHFRVIHYH